MDRSTDLLAEGAAALAASDDLDTTVSRLLAILTTILSRPFAAVTLQDPDRAELQVAVTHGLDESAATAFEGSAMAVDGAVAATAADRTSRMDAGLLHVPLVVARAGIDQVVGVLTLSWPDDPEPSEDERSTLGAFADLLAVGIDRSRLGSLVAERAEWFERVAHSDPLTGLANGRTFRRILELELARAARQGSEVSVALFDIDDFAALNKEAGHGAGDDLLRAVASVLAESIRLVDTVARFGGDEFVVIAPGAAGVTVARRVLGGIAALPLVAGRAVTVSVGIARFPADATTSDDVLAAAQAGLEAARAQGRGQLGTAPVTTIGQ